MRLTANQLIELVTNSIVNGGHTIHLNSKRARYIVGNGKLGLKFPVDALRHINIDDISDSFSTLVRLLHITTYWQHLGYDTVGGWIDDGTFYLDPGNLFNDEQDARRVALERGELAIYDAHEGECIDTSGKDNAARDELRYTLRDADGETATVSYEVLVDLLIVFTKHPSGLKVWDLMYFYDDIELWIVPYHLLNDVPVLEVKSNPDVDDCEVQTLVWDHTDDLLDHILDLIKE